MNADDQIERLKTTGRNDSCPCGSGKKYKKCHLIEDEAARHDQIKKASDERDAVVAADAEKEDDDSETKSDKSQSRKSGGAGSQKGGHSQGAQNRPSNIPRRGAV